MQLIMPPNRFFITVHGIRYILTWVKHQNWVSSKGFRFCKTLDRTCLGLINLNH